MKWKENHEIIAGPVKVIEIETFCLFVKVRQGTVQNEIMLR